MFRLSLLPGKLSFSPPVLSPVLLIKWWMLLRSSLVLTTVAVVWFFRSRTGIAQPMGLLPPALALLAVADSLVFFQRVRRGPLREVHYFLQYVLDIGLVTFLNLITLPLELEFVPLYVLAITVAGMLSLRTGALFSAGLASLCYLPVGLRMVELGVSFHQVFEVDARFPADRWVLFNAGLQVFLFFVIGLATSHLSLRLRSSDSRLAVTRRLLRQNRLDTDEVLQQIQDGLLTIDSEGVVVQANRAAGELLGLAPGALLYSRAVELFAGCCPEIARLVARALESGRSPGRLTVRLEGREDGPRYLAVRLSPLSARRGSIRGLALVLEDTTRELRARQLELRAGKLEAVAELAASLAHEIKNPLASIHSAAELLLDGDSPGPRREKMARLVLRESDRLDELLRQFLRFACSSFGPVESIELGHLLERVAESCRHHPDWRPEMRVELDPALAGARVLGQAIALEQVFANLLLNAVQVEGPGGCRAGRIAVAPAREEQAPSSPEHPDSLWLRVSDDGPGIDSSLREKIFEPFYSGRRGGFGLGLAVVHRIVTALGGLILVEELPAGRGASFLLALPLDSPPARAAGADQSRAGAVIGRS